MVYDVDARVGGWVEQLSPQWRDLLEWCEFHHLDPLQIPAGSRIERNAQSASIVYTRILFDSDGRRQVDAEGRWVTRVTVEQGEAPPLPFPDSIKLVPVPEFDPTERSW